MQDERAPDVAVIQRIQALPPRIFLRDTWWSRLLLELFPRLLGAGVSRGRRGELFRRFTFGTTDVTLRV